MINTKVCTKCNRELPVDCFHKNRAQRDGLANWCKEDYAKYRRTEQYKEYRREYAHAHKDARTKQNREYRHRTGKFRPFDKSPECNQYLGIHIAERVLSGYFDNVVRMPITNPGYDFICKKGYKIDIKSACSYRVKPTHQRSWTFGIKKNTIADYFLCLAFDSRESLNPLHIWLFPGGAVNTRRIVRIYEGVLGKWAEFERPIGCVIDRCNELKIASLSNVTHPPEECTSSILS